MDKKEQIVRHLEMIQEVINRLAHDSFLLKGWSITVLSAGIIFTARSGIGSEWFILALVVPICGFWFLDGYFLWQENLFCSLYDDVRKRQSTDFSMYKETQKKKPDNKYLNSLFSKTLAPFYLVEAILIFVFFWKN